MIHDAPITGDSLISRFMLNDEEKNAQSVKMERNLYSRVQTLLFFGIT